MVYGNIDEFVLLFFVWFNLKGKVDSFCWWVILIKFNLVCNFNVYVVLW